MRCWCEGDCVVFVVLFLLLMSTSGLGVAAKMWERNRLLGLNLEAIQGLGSRCFEQRPLGWVLQVLLSPGIMAEQHGWLGPTLKAVSLVSCDLMVIEHIKTCLALRKSIPEIWQWQGPGLDRRWTGKKLPQIDFRRISWHPKSLDDAFYDRRKQFIYFFKGSLVIEGFPAWYCFCHPWLKFVRWPSS